MKAEADRKQILDRADRMMEQSRTLRKLADELHQESIDLRRATKASRRKNPSKKRR